HQDIDCAETVEGRLYRTANLFLEADVDHQWQRSPTCGFDRRCSAVNCSRQFRMRGIGFGCDHDICSIPGGAQRNSQTNATACASDEESLAFQTSHAFLSQRMAYAIRSVIA